MREQIDQKKIENISWPLAWLMAVLFAGGILLSGSEFVGFPWGQVIGVAMLVVMVVIANWVEG